MSCDLCRSAGEREKAGRKAVEEAWIEGEREFVCPMLFRGAGEYDRPDTSNFRRDSCIRVQHSTPDPTYAILAQVRSKLLLHFGEARAWSEEAFVTAESLFGQSVGVEFVGSKWPQSSLSLSEIAEGVRLQQFFGPVPELAASGASDLAASGASDLETAIPDLSKAVSTIACHCADSPERLCIRNVKIVCLAELCAYYKEDYTFEELYSLWCSLKIVLKARDSSRGTSGRNNKRTREKVQGSSSDRQEKTGAVAKRNPTARNKR